MYTAIAAKAVVKRSASNSRTIVSSRESSPRRERRKTNRHAPRGEPRTVVAEDLELERPPGPYPHDVDVTGRFQQVRQKAVPVPTPDRRRIRRRLALHATDAVEARPPEVDHVAVRDHI